jgi:hypothetical protein
VPRHQRARATERGSLRTCSLRSAICNIRRVPDDQEEGFDSLEGDDRGKSTTKEAATAVSAATKPVAGRGSLEFKLMLNGLPLQFSAQAESIAECRRSVRSDLDGSEAGAGAPPGRRGDGEPVAQSRRAPSGVKVSESSLKTYADILVLTSCGSRNRYPRPHTVSM